MTMTQSNLKSYGSIGSPDQQDNLSDKQISLTRQLVILTLAYPMLTVATPLMTLFILYVLFDCLDQEMCFKPSPMTPFNSTVIFEDTAPSSQFSDEEIRLVGLISLLFSTILIGTLLIIKVKRDSQVILSELNEPLIQNI